MGLISKKSRTLATQKGQRLLYLFKQAQQLLPSECQNLVQILQWDDVYGQFHYKESVEAVKVKFEEDEEFRTLIEDVAIAVARHRDKVPGDKDISTKRYTPIIFILYGNLMWLGN